MISFGRAETNHDKVALPKRRPVRVTQHAVRHSFLKELVIAKTAKYI